MEYEEAIEWLYGTQLFGIKLGLENVRKLCDAWGLPEEESRVVHVAGTNGKGSVCALSESICREAGFRTGRFTSPHLVTYRERIAVDGELIREEEVAALLSDLRERTRDWEPHPTFFELTTVLALRHFRDRAVEIAVLETGMGGRLDATNIVSPAVSVITPIALDHQKWLGATLAEIAEEKAGIIKPGVPVVSAPQEPSAAAVLERIAGEREARLHFVESAWAESEVGLAGRHQRENAALALAALREGGIEIPGEAVVAGLAKTRWPGRFDRRILRDGRELILDGAHNPCAARALARTWGEEFGGEKATVIFGAVESKDVPGILEELRSLAERWIFTRVNSPRGIPPDDLAAMSGLEKTEVAADVKAALALAMAGDGEARRVLVAGSLFLAGEVLSLAGEEAFEISAQ